MLRSSLQDSKQKLKEKQGKRGRERSVLAQKEVPMKEGGWEELRLLPLPEIGVEKKVELLEFRAF